MSAGGQSRESARGRVVARFVPKVAVCVAVVLAMSTGAAAVQLAANDQSDERIGTETIADVAGVGALDDAESEALEREVGLTAAEALEQLGDESGTDASAATDAAPVCSSPGEGRPIFITEDCTDPRFNDAYVFVTVNEVRELPVPTDPRWVPGHGRPLLDRVPRG